MNRVVVDTNVAIVANGRLKDAGDRPPSIMCRKAAVEFLVQVVECGTALLDRDGAVSAQYRRYLSARGQPGIGDRFYQMTLQHSPRSVEYIELPKRADGEYSDLPQPLIDAGFDPEDRVFAALAIRENVPVFNATDSDWVEHAGVLSACAVKVKNLCGCDPTRWFQH